MIWLVGTMFVHAALHLHQACISLENNEVDPFEMIGRCFHNLMRLRVGELLFEFQRNESKTITDRNEEGTYNNRREERTQVVETAAKLLHQAWKDASEQATEQESAPSYKACQALIQLFLATKDLRPAESKQEMDGHVALFLVLQIWRESKMHDLKEDITIWPNDSEFGSEEDEMYHHHHNQQQQQQQQQQPENLSTPLAIAIQSVSKENETSVAFVKNHIRSILWLLAMCCNQDENERMEMVKTRGNFEKNFEKHVLPVNVAKALEYLITNGSEEFIFADIVESGEITCSKIEATVMENLKTSPEACLTERLPISSTLSSISASGESPTKEAELECVSTGESGNADRRIISTSTNESGGANDMRNENVQEQKRKETHVISSKRKQTIIHGDINVLQRSKTDSGSMKHQKHDDDIEIANHVLSRLSIFDCSDATVYCLVPSSVTRIVGCTDCTIILGPCERVLTVEYCSRVTIIGISGHLSINNCYEMNVHVHTLASSPIISGDCRNIVFGPYHTYYPRLQLHLRAIGVPEHVSGDLCEYQWKNPINVTIKSASSVWSILERASFHAFVVPFIDPLMAMPCVENPFRLPSEYSKALGRKIDAIEDLLQTVAQARCPSDIDATGVETSKSKKIQLERAIQGAFKEWLVSTGNVRQLVDLVKLSQNDQQ